MSSHLLCIVSHEISGTVDKSANIKSEIKSAFKHCMFRNKDKKATVHCSSKKASSLYDFYLQWFSLKSFLICYFNASSKISCDTHYSCTVILFLNFLYKEGSQGTCNADHPPSPAWCSCGFIFGGNSSKKTVQRAPWGFSWWEYKYWSEAFCKQMNSAASHYVFDQWRLADAAVTWQTTGAGV